MGANQTRGSREADHYALFDAMPLAWRRLVREADENYKVGWINDLRRRFGDEKAWTMVRRRFADERIKLVLEFYGRTHPQAQVRR